MRTLTVARKVLSWRSIAALLFSLVLLNNTANAIELKSIHAKNTEGGGVVVQILLVDGINEPVPVGWTGTDGVWPDAASQPHYCKSSQRLMVQPDSMQRYRVPGQKRCAERVEFQLELRNIAALDLSGREQRIYGNLLSHLTVAIDIGKYGEAAQIYSDMATLLGTSDVDDARDFGTASYIFAARALDVRKPLANVQPGSNPLMSAELREKITSFQIANELVSTKGHLDSVTLQAMSGKPFWYYQHEPVGSVFSREAKFSPPSPEKYHSSLMAAFSDNNDIIFYAQKAASVGNSPAFAARYYNDLAFVLRKSDEAGSRDASNIAEYYTYEFIGRMLNVDSPTIFDWPQGKYVMSQELSESLIDYKENQGLPENNILDFATIRTFR